MGSMAADVADAKLWNMHTDGFKGILEEFVRRFLFPLTNDGELDLTTKPDHRTLYDPFIKAFGDAIAVLETDPWSCVVHTYLQSKAPRASVDCG